MTEATSNPSLSNRLVDVLARLKRELVGSRLFVIANQDGPPVAAYLNSPKSPAATGCVTLAMSAARQIASYLGLEGNPSVPIVAPGWKELAGAVFFCGWAFTGAVVFPRVARVRSVRRTPDEVLQFRLSSKQQGHLRALLAIEIAVVGGVMNRPPYILGLVQPSEWHVIRNIRGALSGGYGFGRLPDTFSVKTVPPV